MLSLRPTPSGVGFRSLRVSGINKTVPTLEDTLDCLENERAKDAYGVESAIAKQLIFRQELEDDRTIVLPIRDDPGY